MPNEDENASEHDAHDIGSPDDSHSDTSSALDEGADCVDRGVIPDHREP